MRMRGTACVRMSKLIFVTHNRRFGAGLTTDEGTDERM